MTQFLNSKRRLIALSYLVRPNMDSKMFKVYEKSNMGHVTFSALEINGLKLLGCENIPGLSRIKQTVRYFRHFFLFTCSNWMEF